MVLKLNSFQSSRFWTIRSFACIKTKKTNLLRCLLRCLYTACSETFNLNRSWRNMEIFLLIFQGKENIPFFFFAALLLQLASLLTPYILQMFASSLHASILKNKTNADQIRGFSRRFPSWSSEETSLIRIISEQYLQNREKNKQKQTFLLHICRCNMKPSKLSTTEALLNTTL